MKIDQTGTRTGEWEPGVYATRDWPPRGSVLWLPDHEAAHYCEVGMAEPVATFGNDTTEAAAVPPAEVRSTEPLTTGSTADIVPGSTTAPTRRGGPGRPRKQAVQPQGGEA